MNVLLYENTHGYQNALQEAERGKAPLQAALAAYTALGVATQPTAEDLTDLFYHPHLFLERMLTRNAPVTVGNGLAVEPGKVWELLQKPAGTGAFFARIQELRDPPQQHPVRPDTAHYDLENGALTLKPGVAARLLEQYRVYATTQRQLDEWEQLQLIAGALNTIRQTGRFGDGSFDAARYLQDALADRGKVHGRDNQLRPNADYVLREQRLQ